METNAPFFEYIVHIKALHYKTMETSSTTVVTGIRRGWPAHRGATEGQGYSALGRIEVEEID